MSSARRGEQRPEQGSPGECLELVEVGIGGLLARRGEQRALAGLARGAEQRVDLVARGETARDRLAVDATVGEREAGRESGRARSERFANEPTHLLDLVGRRGALVRRVAHDEEPQGGMTDVGGEIEARAAAADRVEIFGEGLEIPDDARGQGRGVHVLDVLERVHDHVVMLRPGGRDREAAVARDHRGHTLVRRRPQCRIPEHLGVVVRVDVDETGRDCTAGRVELALAA